MKLINATVFPSEEKTIRVDDQLDPDYGGAHSYTFQNSIGFKDGKAQYDDSYQSIDFVMKREDGSMMPGIQSEQLVIALIDRTQKLNAKYPSEQNQRMIYGLNIFLEACKERVEDRIKRGVMGNLQK